MKYNFLNATLIFCLIGLFIPGFTAILLLGIQILLTEIGVECSNSWIIIWAISWVGMISLPVYFIKKLRIISKQKSLRDRLFLFNVTEYIFIQASLACFMTSSKTLCYVSDGQNGLELAFTAWLALPILIIFSFIFDKITSN